MRRRKQTEMTDVVTMSGWRKKSEVIYVQELRRNGAFGKNKFQCVFRQWIWPLNFRHSFLCAFEKSFQKQLKLVLWPLMSFSMRPQLLATLRQIYYTFFCKIRWKACAEGNTFPDQTTIQVTYKNYADQKETKKRELLGHKNGNVINSWPKSPLFDSCMWRTKLRVSKLIIIIAGILRQHQ